MPTAGRSRAPVSAVVVSRNEAAELDSCLATLAFCAEIIVVDLESEDDTAKVAEAHGARVLRRPLVPTVERARADIAGEAANDWLLFTDPDEELPPALARQVEELVARDPPNVAVVYAPIQYRFGGRPLEGTVWGGIKERRLLVRRDRVELSSLIYSGVRVLPGFTSQSLPYSGDNAIDHAWVAGWRDLASKHRRYARASSVDRREAGEQTGWRAVAGLPVCSFADSYVRKRGYRDGLTGLALSLFWSGFSTWSELLLLGELRRTKVRPR
jgi:glycosyltransferase involved in cell wall biosynthesis